MSTAFKRVNILIREDQYDEIQKRDLSLSGLVRDLLDDRFRETTISLSLSKSCKHKYDIVVSNFGVSDKDLEGFFVQALDQFLGQKAKQITKLRKELAKKV